MVDGGSLVCVSINSLVMGCAAELLSSYKKIHQKPKEKTKTAAQSGFSVQQPSQRTMDLLYAGQWGKPSFITLMLP